MDWHIPLAAALSLVVALYAFRCTGSRADSGKNFDADLVVMILSVILFLNLAWMEIF